MRTLRIALAQVNTAVGDIDGNARLTIEAMRAAGDADAQIVAFPELAITGYPPEDLVLHRRFVADNRRALEKVAAEANGISAIVGFVDGSPERDEPVYNAAAFLHEGRVAAVYRKIHLPNYGVFDEERYFERGFECPVIDFGGVRIGMSVCEDAWEPVGPAEVERAAGPPPHVDESQSNPFLRYREFLYPYRFARARGLEDQDFVEIIEHLDEAVAAVGGRADAFTTNNLSNTS